MTRSLARIVKVIDLQPIPNADKIERATVEGWNVVVQKGLYQRGDRAVYFEIDSLLPRCHWSDFLFKPGDASNTYRLRTVRLRGVLSQGLLVPLIEVFPPFSVATLTTGDNVTERLRIEKYERPIPAQLAGLAKGNFPNFLRKTDEVRLQSNIGLLDELKGMSLDELDIRLKYDGTSFTAYKHDGVFGVCSRNLELKRTDGNAYWEMAEHLCMPEEMADGTAIQGELCGPGIQGNKLGLSSIKLFIFDCWKIREGMYKPGLPDPSYPENQPVKGRDRAAFVQKAVVTHKPETLDDWLALANMQQYPNGTPAEGIVVRAKDGRYSPTLNSRLSFKVISNEFLLKYGE